MYVCMYVYIYQFYSVQVFLYINFRKVFFVFLISSYQLKEFLHLQITITMLILSHWTSQLNHDINFLSFL